MRRPHSDIRQLLAARLPGVPNLGDLREIDWAGVEPVDVLTAGFSCQDISAGRRAGIEKGTRSGLWTDIMDGLRLLRPARCSLWRTSPHCDGAAVGCTEYLATWPKQGMTRCGVASAPPTATRHIVAKELFFRLKVAFRVVIHESSRRERFDVHSTIRRGIAGKGAAWTGRLIG